MMDGNPYVTDLSDPNRPQRLAEKFNCLYDNSWTDAFEILLAKNKDEKSICEILLKILEVWIVLEYYFSINLTKSIC